MVYTSLILHLNGLVNPLGSKGSGYPRKENYREENLDFDKEANILQKGSH